MPPLSQEEAHTAVELFGSQRAASIALGVPYHTFRYWLNPELQKRRVRERYAADPEAGRARCRRDYHNESGIQRARRRLMNRRVQALSRMAERNQRREAI